jgi:hypothetical protein
MYIFCEIYHCDYEFLSYHDNELSRVNKLHELKFCSASQISHQYCNMDGHSVAR